MATRFEFGITSRQVAICGGRFGVVVRRLPPTLPELDRDLRAKQFTEVRRQLEAQRLFSRGQLNRHVEAAFALFGSARVSMAVSGIHDTDRPFGVLGLPDGAQGLVIRAVRPGGPASLQAATFAAGA